MHRDRKWFKAKRLGWGWAPATIEGWIVTFVYLIIVFLVTPLAAINIVVYFIVLFILTLSLIYICYKTGEKPHWSWELPWSTKDSSKSSS